MGARDDHRYMVLAMLSNPAMRPDEDECLIPTSYATEACKGVGGDGSSLLGHERAAQHGA